MPTESLPQGIVRTSSLYSPGGTRKKVRFNVNDRCNPLVKAEDVQLPVDRWDPLVNAEDIQLQCPQRTIDVQLIQLPRHSSDISPKLSKKSRREESKPRRAMSLLSFPNKLSSIENPPPHTATRKNSLPRTGLGDDKPSLTKVIHCALDVVRDSSEHSQISKELVSIPWETNWKSQITNPHCLEEALQNAMTSAAAAHLPARFWSNKTNKHVRQCSSVSPFII
jgi:hypothetical protein